MEENIVELWINSDSQLSKILTDIESETEILESQAEKAFHKVAEEYNLPKMPNDIDYDDENYDDEIKSVYEVLGLIKYAYPDEDPRGNVMLALTCVKDNIPFDMENVLSEAEKQGIDTSQIFGICYTGTDYNVEIKFIFNGENWADSNCNLFLKTV